MNIKTVDVYYSFKWSERYIEEFKSGHDVILVNPDIPDERKPKELRVQLIKMIMKDFFTRHENLLWNEVNNKQPELKWGFGADYEDVVNATINAYPHEEWNDRVIEQAKLFIEELIKDGDKIVKKCIKISSNIDLESCQCISEYLEPEVKDTMRYHYTLNYRYYPNDNPLTTKTQSQP